MVSLIRRQNWTAWLLCSLLVMAPVAMATEQSTQAAEQAKKTDEKPEANKSTKATTKTASKTATKTAGDKKPTPADPATSKTAADQAAQCQPKTAAVNTLEDLFAASANKGKKAATAKKPGAPAKVQWRESTKKTETKSDKASKKQSD